VTTYTYSEQTGEMLSIGYSDPNTPSVAFTYDRLGRQKTVHDGVGDRTFEYGPSLQLASESIAGPYACVITRSYDSLGRATNVSLDTGYAVGYGYDPLGRFSALRASPVPSVTNVFNYTYLADSDLNPRLLGVRHGPVRGPRVRAAPQPAHGGHESSWRDRGLGV